MSKQLLLMAALCLGLSAPARAEPAAAPRVRVPYGDLNLARPSDIHRLNRRLAGAIDRVCPDMASTAPETRMAARRCHAAQRSAIAGERARVLAGASERRLAGVAGSAATYKPD